MNNNRVEEINNPSKPKRGNKHKHKKESEYLPGHSSTHSIAHTTIEEKGWVGLLIKKKGENEK